MELAQKGNYFMTRGMKKKKEERTRDSHYQRFSSVQARQCTKAGIHNEASQETTAVICTNVET
jgi:hypothetical protein